MEGSAPVVNTPSPAAPAEAIVNDNNSPEATEIAAENNTQPQKYKVKVDQQEMEVALDDLIRNYQKGEAADKRLREAAMARKEAEEFIKLAKSDKKKLFQALGEDPQAFVEQFLSEYFEEQSLSPEQKELRDTKRRLEEYESITRQQEEARQAEQMEQLYSQYEQQYSNDIVAAIQSGGLPPSEYVVKRVAEYMLAAVENGLDVTAQDVIPLVKEDIGMFTKSLYSEAPEDKLIELLGEDVAKKIVKQHLKTVQPKTVESRPPQQKTTQSSSASDKKKHMSTYDFREMIERRKAGLE